MLPTVVLKIPAVPCVLLIINSSLTWLVVVNVWLPINELLILVLKVLDVPPVCPSNVKLVAVTSPIKLNVVAWVNLLDDPAVPDTVPLTFPVKFPTKVFAYTLPYWLFVEPRLWILFVEGVMLFATKLPVMVVSFPTNNFLCWLTLMYWYYMD